MCRAIARISDDGDGMRQMIQAGVAVPLESLLPTHSGDTLIPPDMLVR